MRRRAVNAKIACLVRPQVYTSLDLDVREVNGFRLSLPVFVCSILERLLKEFKPTPTRTLVLKVVPSLSSSRKCRVTIELLSFEDCEILATGLYPWTNKMRAVHSARWGFVISRTLSVQTDRTGCISLNKKSTTTVAADS